MRKQKSNWIVDAVLFLGFQLTFFLDWTGITWHQWLGVFIGILAFYHLLVHWKWVVAVTRRFLGNTSRQSRLYYLLDWAILLSFLFIGFSGLWISTWLDLELANYLLWKDLHLSSSIFSLVLILIKIGAHWRWIVKTARNYFGVWKQTAPAPSPAAVTSRNPSGSLNRREFLQLMGLAGVASLFSATNLIDIGQAAGQSILQNQTTPPQMPDTDLAALKQAQGSCQVICDQGCAYPGQCRRYIDENQNGICDLTECIQQGEIPVEQTQSSAGPDPVTLLEEQAPEGCTVLCSKGCAYPGQCPDYIDLNGNGLCDYGECLESNTGLEIPASSHGGGGGRQRRGNH